MRFGYVVSCLFASSFAFAAEPNLACQYHPYKGFASAVGTRTTPGQAAAKQALLNSQNRCKTVKNKALTTYFTEANSNCERACDNAPSSGREVPLVESMNCKSTCRESFVGSNFAVSAYRQGRLDASAECTPQQSRPTAASATAAPTPVAQ